jgi:hypothetical protein
MTERTAPLSGQDLFKALRALNGPVLIGADSYQRTRDQQELPKNPLVGQIMGNLDQIKLLGFGTEHYSRNPGEVLDGVHWIYIKVEDLKLLSPQASHLLGLEDPAESVKLEYTYFGDISRTISALRDGREISRTIYKDLPKAKLAEVPQEMTLTDARLLTQIGLDRAQSPVPRK